jgi:hypothetical protein
MAVKTLKTLVLKTATVTGVKPTTNPADRIGLGLVGSNAYPMDNLSPGQIPLPPSSEPEQAREWQLSTSRMRKHLRAGDQASPPTSSVGSPSSPGVSADRSTSSTAIPFTGWPGTTWATRWPATGRTHATRALRLIAAPSRVHCPGDLLLSDRLGRDCQSPDRTGDKRIAIREVSLATTAGK